jgi:hypothetical protein
VLGHVPRKHVVVLVRDGGVQRVLALFGISEKAAGQ